MAWGASGAVGAVEGEAGVWGCSVAGGGYRVVVAAWHVSVAGAAVVSWPRPLMVPWAGGRATGVRGGSAGAGGST